MSGMLGQLLSGGGIIFPESRINKGGPLPDLTGAPSQFHAITHAQINDRSRLLAPTSDGGIGPYAWAKDPRLIATQTQMNIPNKKQVVISKLFLPAAEADVATAQVRRRRAARYGPYRRDAI